MIKRLLKKYFDWLTSDPASSQNAADKAFLSTLGLLLVFGFLMSALGLLKFIVSSF